MDRSRRLMPVLTHAALIVTTVFVLFPDAWMVATSVRDLPVEIEESARIDGCSDFGMIWRIVLPIASPGIVTAGIFALLYTTSERAQTAPVLMFYLLGQHQIDYARLMAAAVLLSIPIAEPFAIIQRIYRQGLTEGGVKG